MTAGAAPLPRHLVAVWNPSYQRNAIEEHLAVLLRHAAEHRAGRAADDEVFVWWGRVRSRNRRSALGNLDDIRAIEATLAGEAPPETHVYLTDYQSLYVAELAEVRFGALPAGEARHVPGYYAADALECDFWLKLWDIRRLVADDLLATLQELRKLHNVHYHDQPVSLYGGMVDLPLVVTRPDGASFFDEDERDVVTDAWIWAEFDATLGAGVNAVERALRDDLLGEPAWTALDPAVRTFIATGEKVFRDRRNDPGFDFAPVLTSFSKALEVQVSARVRAAWPQLPRDVRLMNLDGRTVDLIERRSLTLQQLVMALAGDQGRTTALAGALHNGGWFTGQLPAILDEFRRVRNDGTHELRIDRRTATHWRNHLLGVGGTGHFVELAKVRRK